VHSRLVKIIALVLALGAAVSAGSLLPRLLRSAEDNTLRYTDVAIDGAPPIVQLGTAIGALRGIIVDYLWIKVNANKQKGLFYEIMSDSDLITKLQPRFAEVWGFHGHNMAYNVSVLTNTPQERWDWVNAGIRLVREKGLFYNPNDVVLHKELAFWFSHKVDGTADDAHFFYKQEFAREWHLLLGQPPVTHEERAAWMREIADAADTLTQAIEGRPALTVPVELLEQISAELDREIAQLKERDKRHMRADEAVAIVRRLIESADLPDAASKELRRIATTSDDGAMASLNFKRLARQEGVLLPKLPATPAVRELVDRLQKTLEAFDPKFRFAPDRNFLLNYGRWAGVRSSRYAQILNLEATFLANDPIFKAFQEIGADPHFTDAWRVLLAHLRRRVLLDEYRMDPRLMYEYTRDLGPIDWRHPQAHALYFSRRGSQFGVKRYDDEDDIYKILNNDRLQIQAMQALARSGLMNVDIFSNDNPSRLNDVRWIKVLDAFFRVLYDRYYRTRGAGPDSFTNQHENFMKQAVRELYRAGDVEGAQRILDNLDALYGSGGTPPHGFYARPIDVVVQEVTFGEYEFQPEVARSDVYSALERGFREGLLTNNPKVLEDATKFANQVTQFFQKNRYTDFVNKFGVARLGALLGSLETSVRDVLQRLLLDRSLPLLDRLIMYSRATEAQRRMIFDEVKDLLEQEFKADPISNGLTFAQVFPEPPGMETYRVERAAEAARKAEESRLDPRRDFERK